MPIVLTRNHKDNQTAKATATNRIRLKSNSHQPPSNRSNSTRKKKPTASEPFLWFVSLWLIKEMNPAVGPGPDGFCCLNIDSEFKSQGLIVRNRNPTVSSRNKKEGQKFNSAPPWSNVYKYYGLKSRLIRVLPFGASVIQSATTASLPESKS